MTLMLDSDPTLEANAADTQSIHAWSQEDPATEVVDYRPRSWKLPITVAAAALIGIVGAGTYLEWPQTPVKPQQSAGKVQVAPPPAVPTIQASPPVRPLSQDDRFIALLKQRNVIVVSPPLAINGAHETCTNLAKGFTARQIAQAASDVTPGENLPTAATFVATAQEIYCPPQGTP